MKTSWPVVCRLVSSYPNWVMTKLRAQARSKNPKSSGGQFEIGEAFKSVCHRLQTVGADPWWWECIVQMWSTTQQDKTCAAIHTSLTQKCKSFARSFSNPRKVSRSISCWLTLRSPIGSNVTPATQSLVIGEASGARSRKCRVTLDSNARPRVMGTYCAKTMIRPLRRCLSPVGRWWIGQIDLSTGWHHLDSSQPPNTQLTRNSFLSWIWLNWSPGYCRCRCGRYLCYFFSWC